MTSLSDPFPGSKPDGADFENEAVEPDEEPVCANCGGAIGADDLVCPHCGISLVSG